MKSLFGSHINVTAKVLDMRLQRQNVVMSNLANVQTPGYKARRLEFEGDLQKALDLDARGKMAKTEEGHMPAAFSPDGFSPEWSKAWHPRLVHGEDRVDLETEMTALAKNQMMYNALATVIKKNFGGIQKIIQEGQK